MANGDSHKLGTLYMGSNKIARPTKPWRTDVEPYSRAGVGDIRTYTANAVLEIHNTDIDDAYKLQWNELNNGSKIYLVADRNILVNISHDDLNAQGLVTGRNIEIDGQQYKLRLLTGGSNQRNTSDSYSGGIPLNNEWDQWLVNEAGLPELPVPTSVDLGKGPNASQASGIHNQKWNWVGIRSWVQETYSGNGADRINRGLNSTRAFGQNTAWHQQGFLGWRPVLEVMNSNPEISANINGTNRQVDASYGNVNGGWREMIGVYSNVNGIWRKV